MPWSDTILFLIILMLAITIYFQGETMEARVKEYGAAYCRNLFVIDVMNAQDNNKSVPTIILPALNDGG